MFKNLEIDWFYTGTIIVVPAFFAGLSYLLQKSIGFSIAVFVIGLIGMTSLFWHESRLFRQLGVLTGVCVSVGIALSFSMHPLKIAGLAVIGGVLGYVTARWGYHLLEIGSHLN